MSVPDNINQNHIIQAIKKIDNEGIPSDGQSRYYDLFYEGKRYPPKVVVSYANLFANGEILERASFQGGDGTKAFNILKNHGFQIVSKESDTAEVTYSSHISGDLLADFSEALQGAGMQFPASMPARFVASLLTKPFVILTGLSGSGKTKIAISLSKYFSKSYSIHSIFLSALRSSTITETYTVKHIGYDSVDLINNRGSSGKIISLPKKLIFEWFEAIVNGKLTETDDPKEFRHVISEWSEFQKYHHGFYSELAKIAFQMFEIYQNGSDNTISAQYCIVPVGADWTNREPLLGYPNALKENEYVKPDNGVLDLIIRAVSDPGLPYFLILDEMNLSHVERYFADFLSAMESGEPIPLHPGGDESWSGIPSSVTLPPNLFIIGTVNIDETTNMFSPKVLDRANTIEFRVSKKDISGFLSESWPLDMAALEGKGAGMAADFLKMATNNEFSDENIEFLNEPLLNFFQELSKTGAEFGYRSASEIKRLVHQLTAIDTKNELSENQKLDIAVMQKLLPKLHGSRRKLVPILKTLGRLCVSDTISDIEKEIFLKEDFSFTDNDDVRLPLSLEKVTRMYNGAVSNGYAGYAEA